MAISVIRESTLANSQIFKDLNSMGGENVITQKALDLIKWSKHLTSEDIEAAYISVKQITDGLTREALRAFDEGRVVLLYNNTPNASMLQAIPFMTLGKGGQYTTFVFMDKYISINKDGVMNLSAPILRDLLIGAAVSNGLKRNDSALVSNQYLQTIFTEIYGKMFMRILNRQYAISADRPASEIIQYWVNRFFLERIFNSPDSPENINTVASAHLKYIDEIRYSEIRQKYNDANPSNITELLDFIKEASPRMKALSLGPFLSDWSSYYYYPAMLALEVMDYFIFTVLALLSGNNIVSIAASDIVKEAKNVKGLRGEIMKLII